MQFLDCKITLSFSNQKIKDRSETLINKGIYEVKLKFIASLIINQLKFRKMKKINEFSISAFVATVPEVKEFEKSSIARFCLSVSHTENKGDEKVTKTALLPVEKWVSNSKKDELNDLKGKYVTCNGFFKPDTWEEDGKKRSRIIFAVTNMEIQTMKDNEEAVE